MDTKQYDIETIKQKMADDVVDIINTYQIDYKSVALDMGLTEKEMLNAILHPDKAVGSEIYLINVNIRKRIPGKSNVQKRK